MSTMSTSIFEYELYKYDSKIIMYAYMYQKLWFESIYRFEYLLLISV